MRGIRGKEGFKSKISLTPVGGLVECIIISVVRCASTAVQYSTVQCCSSGSVVVGWEAAADGASAQAAKSIIRPGWWSGGQTPVSQYCHCGEERTKSPDLLTLRHLTQEPGSLLSEPEWSVSCAGEREREQYEQPPRSPAPGPEVCPARDGPDGPQTPRHGPPPQTARGTPRGYPWP